MQKNHNCTNIWIENTLVTLSITVITYNQEHYIRKTLDSILNQKIDFSYEIIIGDDASTDTTAKIIQEYKEKYPKLIKPILRNKNIGHTANYIDTTKLCTGKYIAHLDGDDLMLPTKLQKQVDYLETHGECSIVHHPVYHIDVHGNFIKKTKLSKATVGSIKEISLKNRIVNSSNMFRRSSLDEHFFNMRKDLLLHDWLAHIIKAQYGSIDVIPEYLGSYRIYDKSIIKSSSFIKQCDSTLHTLEYAKNLKNIDLNSVNKGLSTIYFTMVRHYFKLGFYKKSRYYLKKACDHNMYSWDNFRYYIKLLLKK